MNILPSTIEKIENASKLYDVISDSVKLQKQGASYYGKCPMCHKEGKGKGLILTPAKSIYKCFSCNFAGNSSIKFVMDVKNKTYPEALKYLADMYNILIDEAPAKPQKKGKPVSPKMKSFRDKQLELSGLSDEDQKAFVLVDESTKKFQLVNIYESGTRDQYGQITSGDDMIIWYYDLEGKPVMYQKPKSNKFEHLFRVRWQNPDLHCDKYGRPMKYSSPFGSGSHIYIPEVVRKAYSAGQKQKRLFIQEGEKKADKACKHGIFSVGIMGIHNIAEKGQLPYELQQIIKKLDIKEVIFVVDADFNHISNNLKPGDSADQRPRSFFRAVCNFRDYFKTFVNMGIYLEIYFGHIIENEAKDKGIDDVLNNAFKKKEDEFFADVNEALNKKEGDGKFVKFYKISTIPETKLLEIWNLDNAEKFCEKHKELLKGLSEFRFNKIKWRYNAEGKLELAQPLLPDEQYWEVIEYKDNEGKILKKDYKFKYKRLYHFLLNRGFCRIMMADGKFQFAYIENNTVKLVDSYHIKDYVVNLTEQIVKDEEIIDMLYRGGKMYLGPDSLSNMKYQTPEFERPNRFEQSVYFKNKYWRITNQGITERNLTEMEAYIWADKINNFEATLIREPLVTVNKVADVLLKLPESDRQYYAQFKDQYFVDFSELGEKSHFIKFLLNTSEFYWEKITYDKNRTPVSDNRTMEERFETALHFLSKMCAIGFLLHRYNNKSDAKAVIGMDGKLSEVGASNGRTGKSIVGFALSHVIPQTYIPGKAKNLTEDRFIFEEVNEKTCNIFVDDVRANVDFEFFFPFLGGRATIEKKAIGKYTLPDDTKPKLYITTNHAIRGDSDSFKDRQYIILFSDFYNATHKPIDDFGVQFFDEWDNEQWNLFYNFMALCVNFYLRFGIIKPPAERIETRRLRQEIGEGFLQWADEYFSVDTETGKANAMVNTPIPRSGLWDSFKEKNANEARFYTPNLFKKKFKNWCIYHKLQFNPHKFDKQNNPGADDKSNGIEFFTVGNKIENSDL